MADLSQNSRSVFVIHGRNDELRKAMFTFLRSINLSPMEWTQAVELTGQGSPYIGQVLDAALEHAAGIVVLMTPDEIAYLQPEHGHGDDDPETKPSPQARPNVLFEAGMALGRDPKRTILVEIGDVRPFSDVAGRHAIRLNNNVDRRQEFANRLKTAGCAVDLSGSDWHDSGDFTAPPLPGGGGALGRRLPSGPATRQPVEFDVKYVSRGGNRIDKLQIINRGTETAFSVDVNIPDDASLQLYDKKVIEKIPGNGRSVTVEAWNYGRMLGGSEKKDVFDIVIRARNQAGDEYIQEVFLDVNS